LGGKFKITILANHTPKKEPIGVWSRLSS
jgi:hypothetical protein